MSQTLTSNWGDWVRRRARTAGYHTQADLAVAVGCTRHQLCRWLKSGCPPTSMRRGFDRSLADVLKVDRFLLFSRFHEVAPEEAPFVSRIGIVAPDPADFRRKIGALVELLPADKLRDFYLAGEAILKGEPAAA